MDSSEGTHGVTSEGTHGVTSEGTHGDSSVGTHGVSSLGIHGGLGSESTQMEGGVRQYTGIEAWGQKVHRERGVGSESTQGKRGGVTKYTGIEGWGQKVHRDRGGGGGSESTHMEGGVRQYTYGG